MTGQHWGCWPRLGTNGTPYWLLILLVLTWAISWPVVKIGVRGMPPLWFGGIRFFIAAGCMFLFVGARRKVVLPSRSDWPLVLISGTLQMAAYSALTGLALTILPPGRASVLAYSTPIWVVPLAVWRLGERFSFRSMLGVGLGLAGILVIVAPSLRRGAHDQVLAFALLLGAAGAWAISIVFVRGHRFNSTPLTLAPWQMLVAAAVLLPAALIVEGSPPTVGLTTAASLAYVGPIATAFAYWAVVEAGRRIKASTMSMGLLATPSLGILISALTLREPVSASLVTGTLLIALGIGMAALKGPIRRRDRFYRICRVGCQR